MSEPKVTWYDSVAAIVDAAESCPLSRQRWGSGLESNFLEPTSLRQAVSRARQDDAACAQALYDQAARLSRSLATHLDTAPTDDWATGEEGTAPDVARYLEGEPECWTYPVEHAPRRVVRLVVDMAVSGSVSTDSMRRRGEAIGALILALERAGVGTHVDVVQGQQSVYASGNCECRSSVYKDRRAFSCFRLKTADQPLDIGRLCAVFLDTAFYRRIMWAAQRATDGICQHRLPFESDAPFAAVGAFESGTTLIRSAPGGEWEPYLIARLQELGLIRA